MAVALSVGSEACLERLEQRLCLREVPHKSIREPDPPYNGALMAIGVCPGEKQVLRRHFSNLPLVGKTK